MNKILTIVLAILLLAALFVNGGCGSSSTETKTKSTSLVTVAIGSSGKNVSLVIRPATLLARVELQLRRAWQTGLAIAVGIPTEVKSISITVSASGMTTITRTIQILGQQNIVDIFEVPNGIGRLFRVGALDVGGKTIYSAEALRDLFGVPVDISFDMKPYTITVTPVAGANGGISPSIPETLVGGSTKQFTLTPNSGYSVVIPVGGTCPQGTLVGTTYTTGPLTTDCTVVPTYAISTLTVTPVAGVNGSISPSSPQTAVSGSTKQFTITPNSGFNVVTPVGGTCPQGTLTGTTYTTGKIINDCTVTPSFSLSTLVTPIAGANGNISPSTPQAVISGYTKQFVIEPNIGFFIDTPVGGTCPQGTLVGTSYTTGIITSNCTVAPTFYSEVSTIFPVVNANGSISPSTPQTVANGSTKQFTITPNTNYSIVTPVGGTCPQGTLVGTTYTTGVITNNCSVAPTFIRNYIVTPVVGDLAYLSISPLTPQVVVAGSTKQFTITPDFIGDVIVTPVGGTCPLGVLESYVYDTGDGLLHYYIYTTGVITNNCTVEPIIYINMN